MPAYATWSSTRVRVATGKLLAGGLVSCAGVTIVPGAGHYVHAEMPDVTAAAVLAFLAGA